MCIAVLLVTDSGHRTPIYARYTFNVTHACAITQRRGAYVARRGACDGELQSWVCGATDYLGYMGNINR